MTSKKRIRLFNATLIITILALFYGMEANSIHSVESKAESKNSELANYEYNNPYIVASENSLTDLHESVTTSKSVPNHNSLYIIFLGVGLVVTVFFFTEITSRIA